MRLEKGNKKGKTLAKLGKVELNDDGIKMSRTGQVLSFFFFSFLVFLWKVLLQSGEGPTNNLCCNKLGFLEPTFIGRPSL